MNKKIITSLVILLAGMFLAGCSTTDTGKESGLSIGGGSSESGSGEGGINLNFLEGNPPSEVMEGNTFSLAFQFKNYQRHSVDDMKIRVTGIDRSYVSGLSQQYNVPSIPSATEEGPGVTQNLREEGVRIQGIQNTFNFEPTFDYCYTAESSLVKQVCVPSSDTRKCDLEVDSNKNSNGPISINVESLSTTSNKVVATIGIENSLNGQVVNECFNTDEYYGNFRINDIRLGQVSGSCEPVRTDRMSLVKGSSEIRCEFSRSGREAYTSQLAVTLESKYQQEVQKSVKINSEMN